MICLLNSVTLLVTHVGSVHFTKDFQLLNVLCVCVLLEFNLSYKTCLGYFLYYNLYQGRLSYTRLTNEEDNWAVS